MRLCWALGAIIVLSWPCAAFAGQPTPPGGHAWVLLKMVFVLAGVCLLAFASLKWGLKRFVAPDGARSGMRVVTRLPIEPRRSILVVRVGPRHLVLGSSEAGIQPLGELSAEEAEALERAEPERAPFARVLDVVARRDVSRETLAVEKP